MNKLFKLSFLTTKIFFFRHKAIPFTIPRRKNSAAKTFNTDVQVNGDLSGLF